MNTRTDASPEIVHLELMSFEDGNAVPEWVHLVPAGMLRTKDGRGPYVALQASELIANSFRNQKKLPIDENHAIDKAGKSGFESRARGWIVEMQERPNGIWGRVEWTKSGRELIEDRAYAGFSPALQLASDQKLVTAVHRASLTNTPNLQGLVTLHSEGSTDMDFLKKLAAALGLADTASEADVLKAVNSMKSGASLHSQLTTSLSLQSAAGEADILAAIDKLKGDDAGALSLQSQIDAVGVALGLPKGAKHSDIVTEAKALALKSDGDVSLQSEVVKLQAQVKALAEGNARSASETYVDAEIARGRQINPAKREDFISLHMEAPEKAVSLIEGIPVFDINPVIPSKQPVGGKLSLQSDQSKALTLLGVTADDFQKTIDTERSA